MAKLSVILMLLAMTLAVAGTAIAGIQITLNNNNTTTPATLDEYDDNTVFDSITKKNPGTDIVPISLTNRGHTIIDDGPLQFKGHVIDLQNVAGSGAMEVGDGICGSNITVDSICIDVLTIAPGSTVTIRAIGSDRLDTTPEPMSLVIWLLFGLFAVLAYRRRR
jgi:hypothetical protein